MLLLTFGGGKNNMKFLKFILIVLVSGFFFLSASHVSAEVVVFRQLFTSYGQCYPVSLTENIIASKNGQPGAGCDFNVEVRPKGEWVYTGGYFDTPPYAWGNDSFYTSGQLSASFTCTNPVFTLDQSSFPSYVQLTKQEDLPANTNNGPGKRYHFSFAPTAPLGTSFNLGLSFQTNCQMKKKGGVILTPVTKSSSQCKKQTEININPRKANLNLPITIGESCGTPTPIPPTATVTPLPTATLPPTTPTPTYISEPAPTIILARSAQAQESQTWRCLKNEPYEGPIMPGGKTDHRLKISGDISGMPQEVYIVGCIKVGNQDKCTSGDNISDGKLSLEKDSSHSYIVADGNPQNILAGTTTLETIVYSRSVETTTHSFHAVFINDPSSVNEGQGSSLQYGTFKFKQDTSKCTAVRWDPYGRVFDAQTLKPIAGVRISLLDENKKLVSLPGLKNPTITNSQGMFHFLVEPGSYILKPKPPEGYQFSTNSDLNPNYKKIYPNIYKPGEIIVEYPGKAELRDIPLAPFKTSRKNFWQQLFQQIYSLLK